MRIRRAMNALRHPITEYRVRKAKDAHRKRFPRCGFCNVKPTFWGRKNDVHHIEPVHVKPGRACDESNLITLCRSCHFLIGHFGNWKHWNGSILGAIVQLGDHYKGLKAKYRRTDEDLDT